MVLVGISIAKGTKRVADQWLAWEVEQAVEWSIGHVECKAAGVLNASLSTFIGLTV